MHPSFHPFTLVAGADRPVVQPSSTKGTEQVVHLPSSIPVHLLYLTAWVNEDGIVHFRNDIYDRDKALDKALRESNPPSRGEDNVEMVLKH
jgi:murein L,D-transpeptidase YcbB/YkuD